MSFTNYSNLQRNEKTSLYRFVHLIYLNKRPGSRALNIELPAVSLLFTSN